MKVLYGYPANEGYNNLQGQTDLRLKKIMRLANAGFNVKPFCMKASPRLPNLTFPQLDRKWKLRDKYLMTLYERFLKEIDDCDIFYNSVGINFHPEFLEGIKQFKIFGCNDDPESSETLSRPVASAYDMCAIGNIAEIDTYKSWGIKNVEWQPMGFDQDLYNPLLTYDKIIHSERGIDIFMIIDKLSRPRRERMRIIEKAFPNAHFYGRGWARGYLPQGEEVSLMQQAKIGINIHNSTGPINSRLYYLPANGVLQICDNKSNLGRVFELNKEVVGFESIEECIDLCHFYLEHEEERRFLAANGWTKAVTEYNEVAVFYRLLVNASKYIQVQHVDYNINHNFEKHPQSIIAPIYDYYESFKINLQISSSKIYRKFFR